MLIMTSDVRKGLDGVVVDQTTISKAEVNALSYRGYFVQELATYCTFEEVAYLIWNGELPSTEQLLDFTQTKRPYREISDELIALIRHFPHSAHPMDILRTAVSYLGVEDPIANDNSVAANQQKAMKLLARIPTIIATEYRLRRGLERIPPRTDLDFAANFFNMCFGEVPPQDVLDCFEVTLIVYAEHGLNPSSFTARVVASTLSDIYSAVTAAIGSLKGLLHGRANEAVMRMLLEIGEPENAQAWIENALAKKQTIMGFGHRIYKRGDPRTPTIHAVLMELARLRGGHKWLEIQDTLSTNMMERKHLYPNVDYETAPIYYLLGFDVDMFAPLFVLGRVVGWTAHFMEQLNSNRMIRPLSTYVGPPYRSVKRPGEGGATTTPKAKTRKSR